MHSPNYKDGSIVNLMSSIGEAMGDRSNYNPLKMLNPDELSTKNVVLIVIDGLGYEFLMKYGKGSIFNQHLKGKITSVFPTTTVAALPVFLTGTAPQEHGMTGWHMFLKELGVIATPMRYIPRIEHFPLGKIVDIKEIFDLTPLSDRIKAKSYVIQENDSIDADFTIAAAGIARRVGYRTMSENFKNVGKIVKSHGKKKFIYSYWRYHDVLCHRYGMDSREVLSHFNELNEELESFLESIHGTDTTVIITADHGMIDTPKSYIIDVKEHPHFSETLTLPLCGDHRYVYCYVHPFKADQFEDYVKNEFHRYCKVFRSEDLVEKNYFGLFKPHRRFLDRIGHYILMMKDNYSIYDFMSHEEKEYDINDHGGASKEEMYVPLIVIHK